MGKKRVKPALKKAGKCASKKQAGDKKPLPFTYENGDCGRFWERA